MKNPGLVGRNDRIGERGREKMATLSLRLRQGAAAVLEAVESESTVVLLLAQSSEIYMTCPRKKRAIKHVWSTKKT